MQGGPVGNNNNDEEDERGKVKKGKKLESLIPSVVKRSVEGREVGFLRWIEVKISRIKRPIDRRNIRGGHCTFFKCFPMKTVEPSIRFDLSNSTTDVTKSFTGGEKDESFEIKWNVNKDDAINLCTGDTKVSERKFESTKKGSES